MNIDEILATSVDDLARSVTPPPPDPTGVRARARVTRRRQWVAAAAGTAAVVVGGVAITSGLSDQRSAPAVDEPEPPSPSIVVPANESAIWSEAKAVHFGSSRVSAPEGVFGFGLVEGGVVYTTSDRDSKVVFQPDDGSDPVQISENAQLAPAGDPTSGLAAWVEAEGKDGSLVVFDTTSGEEVARTNVAPALRPQDNIIFPGFSPVISVSSTAVYYIGPDETIWQYSWRDGDEPEPTGMTTDVLFDVANGVTAQAGRAEGSVEFVTADHTALATRIPPSGYLSPDGSQFASIEMDEGSMPRIVISDTRTGETEELDLSGSSVQPGLLFGAGWSADDTLMLKNIGSDESRSTGEVIACTVTTGECEVVVVVTGRQSFFMTVPLT